MVGVNVKVPALRMLVKYAASGIGAVAGSMLAPWRARHDAKAKLMEAQEDPDRMAAGTHTDGRGRGRVSRGPVRPDSSRKAVRVVNEGLLVSTVQVRGPLQGSIASGICS